MKKELLYVDDASLQRDLFCIFYKKYYNITMASSPEEAFAIIQTKPFDIVVTDLHFNGLSLQGKTLYALCMEVALWPSIIYLQQIITTKMVKLLQFINLLSQKVLFLHKSDEISSFFRSASSLGRFLGSKNGSPAPQFTCSAVHLLCSTASVLPVLPFRGGGGWSGWSGILKLKEMTAFRQPKPHPNDSVFEKDVYCITAP
jgi:CheY-like chemotaxis protein